MCNVFLQLLQNHNNKYIFCRFIPGILGEGRNISMWLISIVYLHNSRIVNKGIVFEAVGLINIQISNLHI